MTDRAADEPASGSTRGPDSKVRRLIDRYGLDGLGAEFERRWTATGDAGASLRDLATEFNQRLLTAALAAEGETLLDGEVENLYRLLVDDDASTGARTKAEHRLRRRGVDVDEIRTEFVSHRAVHTYLTKYRGVTPPSERGDGRNRRRSRRRALDRLTGRVERVTEETVAQLAATGDLTLEDAEVYVDVQVRCPACGAQYGLHDLFDRGGCDCQ